jgi:very-short-patch-repair endonuclease
VEVTARGGPEPIVVHRTRRPPARATRLERAFEDAERLRLLDIRDVAPIPGRRGTDNLLRVLAGLRPGETLSELELRFKRFLREYGLPWPVFNTLVEGILVDAFWPEEKVIAELDSYEFHGKARKPFEDDREKSNRLQLADYKVIRVTSRMLDRPAELALDLRRALSTPAASASGPARS